MPGPEQPLSSQQDLLSRIINDVLPINKHQGLDKRPPDVLLLDKDDLANKEAWISWTQNVLEDEDEDDLEVLHHEQVKRKLETDEDTEAISGQDSQAMAKTIAQWMYEVQEHGFRPDVLQAHLREEINGPEAPEEDLWWEEGLVRVFLPYYDLEPDEIEEVIEGRQNSKTGDPLGRCTVRLVNGDEVCGTFRAERTLCGMGSACGPNMEKYGLISVRGFHCQGILHGQGMALVAPRALWSHIDCTVQLEGIFNDGCLEGPVRGKDLYFMNNGRGFLHHTVQMVHTPYSSLPNKRTCTPYLILTKLPPCTLLFGPVRLYLFLGFGIFC